MTSKNKKLSVLFIMGCILVVVIAVVVGFTVTGKLNDDKIMEGVKIGSVDVGGLTLEEAEQKVENYIQQLQNRQVVIHIEENQIETTAVEIGFSCDAEDSVEKAYMLGKKGNIFERLKAMGKTEDSDKKFELLGTVDETLLYKYVEENCTVFDVKAKNSKLKLVNGSFQATRSQNGMKILVDDTVILLKNALSDKLSTEPLDVTAVVKVMKAKYTKEQVSKCKDLLGSYSTSYATSSSARKTNVQVAAERINGTVIYPGKTFSTIKVIKDRTLENGYAMASEYSSGKVVDGIGGGVCQVSTTLYNAVINAELEIVERSPHSMVVGYVDVSRDAAIAGDYKDFKFRNNTDVPVYIAAVADGSTLSFRIYGEETRSSNRTLKFESKILETIEPGEPKITEDASLPASYRAVTQSAHVGYKSQLWKVIYEDGAEVDRVQVNTSVYAAEPEYITVGKQEASPSPSPSENPKESKKPKGSEKPKATKKPAATKNPKVTATPKVTAVPQETPASPNTN